MNPKAKYTLNGLLRALLWFGGTFFVLGHVVSFVPGSGTPWFIATAILAAAGLLVQSIRYRLAAAIIVTLSILSAREQYRIGIRYQEEVREHSRQLVPQ
jgi:acetyl esterase/lipase